MVKRWNSLVHRLCRLKIELNLENSHVEFRMSLFALMKRNFPSVHIAVYLQHSLQKIGGTRPVFHTVPFFLVELCGSPYQMPWTSPKTRHKIANYYLSDYVNYQQFLQWLVRLSVPF